MNGFLRKKITPALILLVLSALLLTGCIPEGYSSEAKKNVYKHNKNAVTEWFSNNIPAAEIVSMEAYAFAGNLFNAITGEYKTNSGQFTFLYDCQQDLMYLSEYNDEITELISKEICSIFCFVPDKTAVNLYNHYFELTSANDNTEKGDRYGRSLYGETAKVNMLVFLYGSNPRTIAENMLSVDSPQATFSVEAFVEKIPEYNVAEIERIRKVPGLEFVSYVQLADYEYSGITHSVHRDTSAFSYYSNIKKVKDNLYIGYCFREEMRVDDNGEVEITANNHSELLTDFTCEEKDNKKYTVTFPSSRCELLVFTNEKTVLDCYTNSSGKYCEEKISKGSGKKDEIYQGNVYWYDAQGVFSASDLACYRPIRYSSSHTIRLK